MIKQEMTSSLDSKMKVTNKISVQFIVATYRCWPHVNDLTGLDLNVVVLEFMGKVWLVLLGPVERRDRQNT